MKDNIDYYPHETDSHNNAKFFALRVKYGWAGEGMFWALNNTIAKASGCRLDIGSTMRKAPLASLFGLSFVELDEFIEYLEKDCQLIVREGDFITTKTVQETFEKVDGERTKARARKTGKKPSSAGKRKSSAELLKSSPELSKRGEESKGKESKGEEKEPIAGLELSSKEGLPDEVSESVANYVKDKMRKSLAKILPDGYFLPELAEEMGRAFAADGKTFNPKSAGSRKGLETWANRYVERLDPIDFGQKSGSVALSTEAYDRITKMYYSATGRLIGESQRKFIAPVIREYITKKGYTDEEIAKAFGYLKWTGSAFDDIKYALKNIDKLIKWADEKAAA